MAMTTDDPAEPADEPNDDAAPHDDATPHDDAAPDEGAPYFDASALDGPAPEAVQEFPRKWAISALAANIGVLLFCSPAFGLVGIVVAGIGLSRVASRPASARVFVRWAWIIVGVSLVLVTLLNIWYLTTAEDEASTLTAHSAIGTVGEH
jgi:hypothetical protein